MGDVLSYPGDTLVTSGASASAPRGAVCWPTLGDLKMPACEVDARQSGIGGSDANTILSGDPARIMTLWQEKRGDKEPDDLSANLAVMLGSWTEEFSRLWFESLTGETVRRTGLQHHCATNPWRRCTLDGYLPAREAIWEAKHTNAFAKPEEVLDRYMPQMQHNMAVARAQRGFLCVLFGNHKYEIFEIAADWVYQIELLQAELDFWTCVETGRQPVAAPVPSAPRVVGTREVCLTGNNRWSAAAADWLNHRDAAKRHAEACKTIKALVEDDVSRAYGHGIEAKRSKSGAISIREQA